MSKEMLDRIIEAVDTASEINEDNVNVKTGKVMIDLPSESK